MATTIVTKYGGDAPAASDIVRGELAVDTENGRLYTENSSGAVVELGLNPEGNVNITGTLTADAGIDIDNINIDGTTIALSSGDLTLDVAGDISLDADGGDIRFKDGGTEFYKVAKNGDHVQLFSTIQDGDLTFNGFDGASHIVALTLDMSEAGFATFNNGIKAGRDISAFGANTGSSANRMALSMEGSGVSRIICNGPDGSTNGTFEVFTAYSGGTGSVKLGIDASGNVGIGVAAPLDMLHLKGADPSIRFEDTSGDAYAKIEADSADEGSIRIQADAGNSGANSIIRFDIDGGEKARLTTTGLGIGTSSDFGKLRIEDTGWSSGSPYGTVAYILGGDVNDANWGHLLVSQSGTTTGSRGKISFGANGDNPIAGIKAYYAGATYGHLDFYTRPSGGTSTQRMRIDSSGNLLVGTGSGSTHIIKKAVSVGSVVLEVAGNNLGARFYNADGGTPNAANTAVAVYSVGATGRSVNAAGTVNANGADYAEYERNNGLSISKGSIVGFKEDGTLTLTFSEAIRFAVKSTDPSFVGGDTWGTEAQVGAKPNNPTRIEDESDADFESREAEYETDLATFEEALEAARQLVDRIAYSGKVPVNIQGATAGNYIIAVAADDGSIDGQAVADPDFTQYKLAVGRVNRILDDGRAEIAVIIH